jgi:transposase
MIAELNKENISIITLTQTKQMVTTKKKQLSQVNKSKALAWRYEDVPNHEIARRLGVNRRTISRLFAAYQKSRNGVIPKRKPGSGRCRKITEKMLTKIKKDISANPFLSAREIKTKNRKLLENVSLRTIRRVLLEDLGLPSRVAAKKPKLSEKMKRQRVAFAEKYYSWTAKQWSQVLFSDESLFETSQSSGRLVRRSSKSDRYSEKFTSKTKRFPPKLMVWGCFSADGRGSISVLPRNQMMDSTLYLKILKQKLKPSMKSNRCVYYQQDNSSVHTAKKVQQFFKENKIEVIKWPGNSPDLAPIENCWGYMKKVMEGKDISSISKLKNSINSTWRNLKFPYFKTLAISMPKRLKFIIENNGAMLKY